MKLRTVLRNVPDPRGKQGQDYVLWSILGLIVVSLLCGRRGMLAAFHLGRGLTKRQRLALGFTKGATPCHATLTETLRAIDGRALAEALGAACFDVFSLIGFALKILKSVSPSPTRAIEQF